MFIGIAAALLAGAMLGLYALPGKYTMDFEEENKWSLFFVLTMFVVPLVATFALMKGVGAVYSGIDPGILITMIVSSFLWVVGDRLQRRIHLWRGTFGRSRRSEWQSRLDDRYGGDATGLPQWWRGDDVLFLVPAVEEECLGEIQDSCIWKELCADFCHGVLSLCRIRDVRLCGR
jgi:hypothetical protein